MNTPLRRALLGAVLLTLLMVADAQAQAQRARQGLLSLADAQLFYEVVGSGDPIIVVHGGPGLDHGYLRPGLDVLAARNTLVYYDQRGTGRSTSTLDTTGVSLTTFVDDIEALRLALGFERVTVLTHSFGTLFGIEYARRYPAALRSLILVAAVEPGARFQDATATRQAAARTEEDRAELAALTSSEGFAALDPGTLSAVYQVAFRGTFHDRSRVAELDLTIAETTAKNGQEVGRLLGASLGTVDWWDRLGDIETPTLVVHGRYDLPPVAMATALAEEFSSGSLVVLESGHFPYIEDAEGLASSIATFFVNLTR